MTIPSCLWACTFNLCFQNPADSALVMENNWPTLQSWLLLLLLRSVQRLICQQPPESRGGRAQRFPRRCRLATLSSSLSSKSQHSSKVSAAAADETRYGGDCSFLLALRYPQKLQKQIQMFFRSKVTF